MNTLVLTTILVSTFVLPTNGEHVQLEQTAPIPKVDVTPIECGVERETPQEDFLMAMNLANGLEIFLYDGNHDKRPDFELLVPQGDENRYPLFYRIDRDYDGFIDIAYIDDRRDGTCDGIRVYWTPKMDKPSNRHNGTPIPDGGQCEEEHYGKGKET